MKKLLKSLFAVLICVSTVTACTAKMDKPVATVEGQNITYARYLKELAIFKAQIQMQFGDAVWSQTFPGSDATFLEHLKTQILDNMVTNAILTQKAEKEGLKIDEKEFENEVKFTVEALSSNETMKKYYEDNGVDEEYVRNMIRESMLASMYHDNFIEKNKATDEEIKKYYDEHLDTDFKKEQVKASHILIKTIDQDGKDLPQDQIDKAKAKIDEIYTKLMAGENFEELAKANSQDPSKDNGGDLGYFGKGMMVPEFEQKAFSMNVGEVSEPVKTQYGYHIIKLTDKKTEVMSLEDAKDGIKSKIEDEKFSNEINKIKDDKEKVTQNPDMLKDAEKDIKEDALKQEPEKKEDSNKDKKSEGKSQEKTDKPEQDKTENQQKQQQDKAK